ncbi:TIGR03364 family FAD-dependent oxidoreductase [Rubrimonas cliftonensis]|uniref:FAD dependent oxidoreductase TIGR03364 n=1 Tax=Rubrimonas cliftonensis TaxID=89524 RepID=A0A1H4FKC9_9RHOB|nr:TIGR03364 family FAD-dependent oxidoreductase [Rubrimonas cliftonensis]SEA97823.1 FAD dependent oxidoreductase TIGR03364 [Rubrimonas cliftonensis]
MTAPGRGPYDLAVVGAGVVGLATAYAGVRRGLRVLVVDRSAEAVGASVRNFGFVTITGQRRGAHWARAKRSRDIWAGIAPQAGIEVLHEGLLVLGRRPEAAAVLDAFAATEMGEGCRFVTCAEARGMAPPLACEDAAAILHSPHELRVESRDAIPRLARWLEDAKGVSFLRRAAAHAVTPPRIETSAGTFDAGAVVVCPGDEFAALFPERIAAAGLRICTLQMLRLAAPGAPAFGAAVMSDLSLVRYEGYSALPEAAALAEVLRREQGPELDAGIHLIAVQSADRSFVVGDSHVYGDAPAPFAREALDDLILAEFDRVLPLPGRRVVERWTGAYASGRDVIFHDRPAADVRLLIVTGGTGASTAFALGEDVLADLFDAQPLKTET